MSNAISSRCVLDAAKRQTIISLLINGSSRRVAARYVGCAPSTITRTAAADPEFAARIARAEQQSEVQLLSLIRAAALDKRYWRAAAWILERRNPHDFAARSPNTFRAEDLMAAVCQLLEAVRKDLPEENYHRAAGLLDKLAAEFRTAEAPLVIEAVVKAEGGESGG